MRGILPALLASLSLALASVGEADAQDAAVPDGGAEQATATDAPAPAEADPESATARAPDRVPERVPLIDLSQIRTRDLNLLYFDPAQTYLTPYVGRAFQNALALQKRLFGWEPWEPTTVLLKDFSDYGNAAARSSPNNALIIDVAPLSQTFETFSAGERFFTLTNHELVHVATMDVWNEDDARWRRFFFGKPTAEPDHPETILYNFLTTPRVNVPRWYLEGSAVFMETWMAGGYGRAQGGYDEMVFRSMVRDGAHFYSPVGLESEGIAVDFQVGVNDYLYGTRFFSWLALTKSPESVVRWVRRDEDSAGYYATQFERVFGQRLDAAWDDWIAWEHAFQAQNLASVRAYPETPFEPLSPRALGSVSRAFLDPRTGELIGAFRYPGVIGHVGVLSPGSGEVRKLADVKGAMLYRVTSLAYDPDGGRVWYTADNYAYRDLMEIDLATGRERMLQRDSRIGDIVYNRYDRTLWGLRHLNGYVTLVRMVEPYGDWNQIHTFDFGQVPFDLDVSADGSMLAMSIGEVDGSQTVQVFGVGDALAGDMTPIATLKLGESTPEGFVFSPDGRYLYGSAYYTGVSNIFRFEIGTQTIEAVSNASTGFFRPIPRDDGSLVVFEYAGDGFRPGVIRPEPLQSLGAVTFLGAEIARTRPVVTEWAAGSPARVDLEPMIVERGKYRPGEEMSLGAAYPVVEGYKDGAALGWHAVWEDPLQFNQLKATVTYSPDDALDEDERWHVDLEYRTTRWKFRYWRNDADFYDLFGPTERARKGDAVSVGHHRSLIYDPPRQLELNVDAAFYRGLDTLPAAQEVSTAFRNLATVNVALAYTDTTRSLGAVDHEKGLRWDVSAGVNYATSQAFPYLRGGFDIGRPLPIPNSSVWLYTAAGAVGGDAASPLGSVYMGAFGNNYVDDRAVKRYREWDSFPGFEINEISARSHVRALAEWNLPPIRFREVGTASLYLSSARTAVFAGAMSVDPAAGDRRSLQTAGVQVDFNFTLALRLPMVLSVGYAEGFEDGERRGGETLISLKIM